MTAIVFKPPFELPAIKDDRYSIFLAGSIEQGQAKEWQKDIELMLKDEDIDIFNPRRDNWDWSTPQTIKNEIFKGQVYWELNALERADYILMVFDPNTKSPISLHELGLFARSGKMVVICPEGFWRKGNVDITCEYFDIPQFDTVEEAINYIKFNRIEVNEII